MLRSQMLSPIAPQSLAGLRQLADKMEKILLVALENYGNTFVEPKVELGARFGHLVCASLSPFLSSSLHLSLPISRHASRIMHHASPCHISCITCLSRLLRPRARASYI